MRLFEMRGGSRPKKAGKATLEYDKVGYPRRDEEVITLPQSENWEFFKLQKGWNQFLICQGESVWFGGTDENPFLVRMNSGVFYDFLKYPTLFYDRLVPETMENLNKIFPKREYRRQGDIFAFPLPYSWKDIEKAFRICYRGSFGFEEEPLHLFGTRHILTGKVVTLKSEYSLLGGTVRTIAEGIVEAPDHSPMELIGPHAMAQTYGLYSPQEAD